MKIPFWVSVAVLAVVILGGQGLLSKMHIDNAPEVYVPADAPAVVFDRDVRETFPTDEALTALFRAPDMYAEPFQAKLRDLVERLEQIDNVDRVTAITNADHIAGTADGFEVEALLDEDVASELDNDERRARVLGDRFAPGNLVSENGDTMVVSVRPMTMDGSFARRDLTRAVRAAIAESGLGDALYGITGSVELDAAQLESMLADNMMFLPLTVLVGALLTWWLFRRPLAVVMTLVSLAAVTSFTMALLIVWGKPFTMSASIISPLMSALTVALVVHICNALRHASARGLDGEERLRNAFGSVRRPAMFTALTTAAGLASLALSPVRPIAAFGIVTAIGVLWLYVVVMYLLPPIVRRLDRSTWQTNTNDRSISVLDDFVGWCAAIGIRKAGWVVAVFAIVFAAGVPYLGKVVSETDIYEFFPPDHSLSKATKHAEDALSGVNVIQMVFDGDGRDSLKDPTRLALIDDFQSWAEARADVARTISFVDLVEEMNWAFNGEDPDFRTVPDDGALIAQYLFIYDDDDIHEVVNREYDRTLVTMSLTVRGANATSVVMDASREWIDRELAARGINDMSYDIAGLGRKLAEQEDLLITGQVRSLAMALLLIFVFMLALWRNIPMALLTMVPNTAPIFIIFMLMGMLTIWLDFATAMIASVAVGIAVDDTVHLFHGYLKHRGRGASVVAALGRTYRHAGRAVVITTIILGAQFGMLVFSAFNPTGNFGLLTTVGLVTALLFDLLLLPAALVLLGNRVKPVGAYAPKRADPGSAQPA